MYSGIVTRISLSICLMTAIILLIMLSVVLVNVDGSYTDFIQSRAITQNNMQLAIMIAGLVLVTVTALLSWLISLYSSFRIAGPLYRFTHNLAHYANTEKMIPIRTDDQLQALSKKIINAAQKVGRHKQALLNQIETCQQTLRHIEDPQHRLQLARQLQQLKQLDDKIKLDD